MKKTIILITVGILIFLFISQICQAEIPPLIRYQGKLNDEGGIPLEGPYNLTFRIYDEESEGEALWTETQTNIQINEGFFNVLLGQITPLNLPFDKNYWLSIQVNDDEEMTPRQLITSVAYTFRAKVAETAEGIDLDSIPQGKGSNFDADKVDGYEAVDLLDLSQHSGTVNPTSIAQGPTSGLHADLLDNQHGEFYLNLTNHTGILSLQQGGTGALLVNDPGGVLYCGASAIQILSPGTSGRFLQSGSTGTPSWQKIDLSDMSEITGTLATNNGGTGTTASANTANGVVVLDDSGKLPEEVARDIGCSVYLSANQTLVNRHTDYKINLDVEKYDTHNAFISGTFTTPFTGKYLITAQIMYKDTSDGDYWCKIKLNGQYIAESCKTRWTEWYTSAECTIVVNLNQNDRIEIYGRRGGAAIVEGGVARTYLMIQKLTPP